MQREKLITKVATVKHRLQMLKSRLLCASIQRHFLFFTNACSDHKADCL